MPIFRPNTPFKSFPRNEMETPAVTKTVPASRCEASRAKRPVRVIGVMGKHWWKDKEGLPHPFELPRNVSQRICACAAQRERAGDPTRARYLWIHMSEKGPQHESATSQTPRLSLEDWLNVIDEASSLGVSWLIVWVGDSLCSCPDASRICQWAQDMHGMRVGLHFNRGMICAEDVQLLKSHLKPASTYLFVEAEHRETAQPVEKAGFSVCVAGAAEDDALPTCDIPEDMVCVGPRGRLYTCGLVLGNEQFCLGNVREHALNAVMDDTSLPHVVPSDLRSHEHGCDHCPPSLVKRLVERLP